MFSRGSNWVIWLMRQKPEKADVDQYRPRHALPASPTGSAQATALSLGNDVRGNLVAAMVVLQFLLVLLDLALKLVDQSIHRCVEVLVD